MGVGQGGIYDFQRSGNGFNSAWTYASNYVVGIVMNGAGFSQSEMVQIASGYAAVMSRNAGDPAQLDGWINGWEAAASGACN